MIYNLFGLRSWHSARKSPKVYKYTNDVRRLAVYIRKGLFAFVLQPTTCASHGVLCHASTKQSFTRFLIVLTCLLIQQISFLVHHSTPFSRLSDPSLTNSFHHLLRAIHCSRVDRAQSTTSEQTIHLLLIRLHPTRTNPRVRRNLLIALCTRYQTPAGS